MTKVISFEHHALGRLRERLAQLDEANADLLAFARGHMGAVAQIHAAALAAIEAESFEHLVHVVTQDWTDILGVDAVALALAPGAQRWRDISGLQIVDPDEYAAAAGFAAEVSLRSVELGSPLFGPAAALIRSEAIVRLAPKPPLPAGLLALGARQSHNFAGGTGSELLSFLGAIVSRMMARWLLNPT